ncbi:MULTISPECIES: helix-turn-helix transcriptional regulator [unclassified Lactobacillus]|uniref:helix-turn-helix transcriptional regulator n=1 Tax=unclassified Lactobacillus TaxID=2620435 RepID=UPI00226AF3AA|nr:MULTISPECIES: helix-turn-helix transcriptional regulator [unclassified Lactobacillus]MCX8720796.1 helix-turn-helix transcriptional regulator [Lactobacillus sp. B4010]MCX8733004.1 helix-turn-helix transcriptional regulator [Lactobacillus sp. B4015]MCX8735558.1 helix-turn-helix transcriptional regulator [Lactobacillus sp. B4012]
MIFNNRIKELREKKDVSQGDLAKVTGLTRQAISNYENNERTPNKEIWEKLASYFNVSVPYLKGAYSKKEILVKLQQEYICGSKENSNSISHAIKNSEITFNVDLIAIAKGIVFYDQPNFNLLTEKEITNFYFWEKNFSFIFDNLAINWLVTKPLDATDEDISNALNDALSVELLRLERDDRDQQEGDEWIESPKELLEKRQDYINKHIFTDDDGASYVDFTKTTGQ